MWLRFFDIENMNELLNILAQFWGDFNLLPNATKYHRIFANASVKLWMATNACGCQYYRACWCLCNSIYLRRICSHSQMQTRFLRSDWWKFATNIPLAQFTEFHRRNSFTKFLGVNLSRPLTSLSFCNLCIMYVQMLKLSLNKNVLNFVR